MAASLWHGKAVRRLLLGLMLIVLALQAWQLYQRSQRWQRPLQLVIYPINADNSRDTGYYLDVLTVEPFKPVQTFLQREARRYGLNPGHPLLKLALASPLDALPPPPPQGDNLAEAIIWSLKMRWWAALHDDWWGPDPDIRIFLQLHSAHKVRHLQHSVGIQKGQLGLVNGFAGVDYQAQNNILITHELLHTLGATDKYEFGSGYPRWPEGYADPEQQPLLPQRRAEIMAGRIQVLPGWAILPPSLERVIIGPQTAAEINWPVQ